MIIGGRLSPAGLGEEGVMTGTLAAGSLGGLKEPGAARFFLAFSELMG